MCPHFIVEQTSFGGMIAAVYVGVLPRMDGPETPPPLPRVFLLLHVTTAPEDFEHKHRTFNAPTLGDIGS